MRLKDADERAELLVLQVDKPGEAKIRQTHVCKNLGRDRDDGPEALDA